MDMLTVQDVRFRYEYPDELPVVVLDGIDLAVEKGSFVALLGHNGSGKSTLAKHFNALLLPTGGCVLVDGVDTREEARVYDIRRMVGMVLQNPDNQLVSTIVEEDVAFGPENLGVPPQEIRRRVDEALKQVGMYEYRRHTPHKLSGGQKQRVVVMDGGSILMDGTPRQVFSQVDRLKAAELDVPQPTELCDCLRKKGVALPADILTAGECAQALAALWEV